ncbi:MAG: iron-sulfur cluster-binding protein [Rhodospirillales bacterium]|jgi:L-lactate dehydrogenase complex protein LldF|nr:iron-sulfur cluster-binding protein [Rhodospirillaceae bacterium]MBT3556440.1 iron-sulfur cluster-binding protein [Rhodospirillales bacterium]MBT4039289.1 iron-sulfur cluster-binding protein [Rhodospirillales bacterium]MBT4628241.1 iron-sulfur cluster-binding protein [Rhodospirillales bacterium]MBT5351990.1 iron-sulfur cluster-binding protein [Rhodospirillales bacterium]
MKSTASQFPQNAREALADETLQNVLENFADGFPRKRAAAISRLDEFDDLRDAARDIKNHVLANLDTYLTRFEERVLENGGQVHWCRDAAEACQTILEICQAANARTVTKSKSMIGEEIAINDFLERHDIEPVETDLGEYIIQLREEPPSHIIAPAIHLSKEQVAETFVEKHTDRDPDRTLTEPRVMLDEARAELRGKFLGADVGLTGANMLVAETGSIATVTNEGNADLTMGLPRVHVALASIEKIVPTLEDASTILRVLARSATGQEMSVYTTFATGPKRSDDLDGPEQFHVVLLDNGRSELLGSEFQDILRCIRCGSCINHCPVYSTVGGHAYGWVYPGPMGSVLSPALIGLEDAHHLPNASTLCGKCETVCPMHIPLPRMLRSWRTRQVEQNLQAATSRYGLELWAFMAKRPRLYRVFSAMASRVLRMMAGKNARIRWLPLGGGWTSKRDMPAPQGPTFMSQWKQNRDRYS